jgi:hypothetical protein
MHVGCRKRRFSIVCCAVLYLKKNLDSSVMEIHCNNKHISIFTVNVQVPGLSDDVREELEGRIRDQMLQKSREQAVRIATRLRAEGFNKDSDKKKMFYRMLDFFADEGCEVSPEKRKLMAVRWEVDLDEDEGASSS